MTGKREMHRRWRVGREDEEKVVEGTVMEGGEGDGRWRVGRVDEEKVVEETVMEGEEGDGGGE